MQRNRALRALCLLCCLVITSCCLAPRCKAQEAAEETLIAEITTQKGPLKLRGQPSKQGKKVLCEIPRGTFVAVAEYDEDWFAASYNGLQGYIMTEYATLTEGVDSRILDYQTLQQGDCGDPVLACKRRLEELGYYRKGSKMTNRYNETLAERVRLFQRVNGLEENGVATPKVQAALYSEDALINTEPLPASKPATHYGGTSSASTSEDGFHREVCSCCEGRGCVCCDHLGYVWVPD